MIARARFRSRITAAFAVLLALALAGCGQLNRPWGDVRVGSGQPVRLGVLTDLDSGRLAAPTPAAPESIDGHPIELVPVPVHCAATAIEAAPDPARLTDLAGVVGSGCSSACIYAESLLWEQKTPLVASGCTAPAVVQSGYALAFRISWTDADQATVAADYARSALHASRAVFIGDQSAYARALLPVYRSEFKRRGGKSVAEVDIPVSGDVAVRRVAAQVESSGTETILLAVSRPDAARLFADLQAALPGRTVIATDTVFAPSGDPPAGLVAVGLARGPAGWTSELQTGPLSPDLFAAQQADAVRVYARAIARAARPQPDGTLQIPRQGLRDAIARLKLSGETGQIEFDGAGERRHDVGAVLYRLGDGQPVPLQTYKR